MRETFLTMVSAAGQVDNYRLFEKKKQNKTQKPNTTKG